MLLIVKDILKELLIVLVITRVVWFLVPRPFKKMLKGVTKSIGKLNYHVRKRVHTYYRQKEKAAIIKQPSNVIKVQFPNGQTRKYNTK